MPRRQLEKVLVAELGDGWREKVDDFEYDPLAAASIGQVCLDDLQRECVHTACLAGWSGQETNIKRGISITLSD